MAKSKGYTNAQMDAATIGPIAAQVKRSAKPAQWKRLLAEAHKQGIKVNSFLDGSVPTAMKERTKDSLRQEAYDTVESTYKPLLQDIENRKSQLRSVDEKRALDNERFASWLSQQNDKLHYQAQAADVNVVSAQQKAQTDLAGAAQQMQAGFLQQQNPTGQVSNPAQYTGVSDLQGAAALGQSQVQNQRDLTANIIGNNATSDSAKSANSMAYMASLDAQRQADTWKGLSDLGNESQKAQLSKAADAAQRVSDLLQNEQTKASWRGDDSIARETLNIKDDANTVALQKLSEAGRHNKATEALTRSRLSAADRVNDTRLAQGQERNDIAWYNARHGSDGSTGESKTAKNDPQTRFDQAYASLAAGTRKTKDGKSDKPLDASYVGKGRASQFESMLVAKLKISPAMARAVMKAYLQRKGSDPGDYTQYLDNSDAANKR